MFKCVGNIFLFGALIQRSVSCANIEDLVSPWDLFIAERSALKRASQWSLKQTIMLSSS